MPVPLRSDFDTLQLRTIARKTKNGPQARRLLALASIYNGARRTEAAKIGGVTLQIVRDWVMKFNAYGPNGLISAQTTASPSYISKQSSKPRVWARQSAPKRRNATFALVTRRPTPRNMVMCATIYPHG